MTGTTDATGTDASMFRGIMTDPDRAYELDRRHVFHSWSAQGTLDPR
jgi:hypothetical protein